MPTGGTHAPRTRAALATAMCPGKLEPPLGPKKAVQLPGHCFHMDKFAAGATDVTGLVIMAQWGTETRKVGEHVEESAVIPP